MEKIKIFEAFAGYGSQSMALELLKDDIGLDYEVVGISEIDPTAIKAYYAARDPELSKVTVSDVENALRGGYQPPKELVEKYPNFGDISLINWEEVPDFNLLTYSFPCTDISNAGLQKGLAEGSGTRSSLLWECARAIEIKRPKYLLMENVKALVSDKFMPDFKKWAKYLESLGYSNHYQILNSKDYGVPQNRERVFMVSIYGEAIYYFPKPFKLDRRLKHVLETNVDESYYLSDAKIQAIIDHCERKQAEGCGFKNRFVYADKVDTDIPLNVKIIPEYPSGMGIPFNRLILSRPCYVSEFMSVFVKNINEEYNGKVFFIDGKNKYEFANIAEAMKSDFIITKTTGIHNHAWYNNDPWSFDGLHLATEGGLAEQSQDTTDTVKPIHTSKNEDDGIIVVGKINNSQDGKIVDADGIAPTHTSGHGNCPKVLVNTPPRTICLNSKDETGKQPSIHDRVYDSNGIATALTTGWHPCVAEYPNNQDNEQ